MLYQSGIYWNVNIWTAMYINFKECFKNTEVKRYNPDFVYGFITWTLPWSNKFDVVIFRCHVLDEFVEEMCLSILKQTHRV